MVREKTQLVAFEGTGTNLKEILQCGTILQETDVYRIALQLLSFLELSHKEGITGYVIDYTTVFALAPTLRSEDEVFTITYQSNYVFAECF